MVALGKRLAFGSERGVAMADDEQGTYMAGSFFNSPSSAASRVVGAKSPATPASAPAVRVVPKAKQHLAFTPTNNTPSAEDSMYLPGGARESGLPEAKKKAPGPPASVDAHASVRTPSSSRCRTRSRRATR